MLSRKNSYQFRVDPKESRCGKDFGKSLISCAKWLKSKQTLVAFLLGYIFCFLIVSTFWIISMPQSETTSDRRSLLQQSKTAKIIVITPTHKRPARLADMTRTANTLRQISNLHWIVVEDGPKKVQLVEDILKRSNLSYTYLNELSPAGKKCGKGLFQRDAALDYLRRNTTKIVDPKQEAVVYFADDDNSYDLRIFDEYIRNVKKVGIWAVGTVGDSLVESPVVINGTVVGWDVIYEKNRAFATDMAGFAINLKMLLMNPVTFVATCLPRRAPETMFLSGLGITLDDLEPFGFDEEKREMFAWHTKTVDFHSRSNDSFGYNNVEY